MLHTTALGNIFATFQSRPISQWEAHDGENMASRTVPHLNSHARLRRGCAARNNQAFTIVVWKA
jgi:hypothetical protein